MLIIFFSNFSFSKKILKFLSMTQTTDIINRDMEEIFTMKKFVYEGFFFDV